MHAHTPGISECCLGDAETIIKVARENGIDGIVLTNHYQKSYLRNGDANELAKRYIEEYRMTKRFGEKYGVTVIYGMEVTMHRHDNSHLLVYGLPESFTEEFPEVYDMTQEELDNYIKVSYPSEEIVARCESFVNLPQETNELVIRLWSDILIGIDEDSWWNQALMPVTLIITLALCILIILLRYRKAQKKRAKY
jgi:hypothetical protein